MRPYISVAKPRTAPVIRLVIATLLSASLLLSGCTTMRSVAVPAPGQTGVAVQVGDHLEVQTKAGQTLTFTVTQIEPDAFAGKDVRVKFDDISGLQVRRIDQRRSAAAATGVVAVVLIVGLAVGLSKMGPGLGP